jgi:hypothetical protein
MEKESSLKTFIELELENVPKCEMKKMKTGVNQLLTCHVTFIISALSLTIYSLFSWFKFPYEEARLDCWCAYAFYKIIYIIPLRRIRKLHQFHDSSLRKIVKGLQNVVNLLFVFNAFVFFILSCIVISGSTINLHNFLRVLTALHFLEVFSITYIAATLYDSAKANLSEFSYAFLQNLDFF